MPVEPNGEGDRDLRVFSENTYIEIEPLEPDVKSLFAFRRIMAEYQNHFRGLNSNDFDRDGSVVPEKLATISHESIQESSGQVGLSHIAQLVAQLPDIKDIRGEPLKHHEHRIAGFGMVVSIMIGQQLGLDASLALEIPHFKYRMPYVKKERINEYLAYLGAGLKSGRLIINSQLPHRNLGYMMAGGELVFNGNAGNYSGEKMQAGKIIVNGNALGYIGKEMSGGEIVVLGDAKACGVSMTGGRIIVYRDLHAIASHCKCERGERGEKIITVK
jgi:hypothetical protein